MGFSPIPSCLPVYLQEAWQAGFTIPLSASMAECIVVS